MWFCLPFPPLISLEGFIKIFQKAVSSRKAFRLSWITASIFVLNYFRSNSSPPSSLHQYLIETKCWWTIFYLLSLPLMLRVFCTHEVHDFCLYQCAGQRWNLSWQKYTSNFSSGFNIQMWHTLTHKTPPETIYFQEMTEKFRAQILRGEGETAWALTAKMSLLNVLFQGGFLSAWERGGESLSTITCVCM